MAIQSKAFIVFTLLLLFNALDAQDAPESCPAGEHLVSGKCELCPPGTYREHIPIPWYNNEDECQLCPKGTFQPHYGAVGVDLCQECPFDTFAANEGSAACEKCPQGELAPRGSSECKACPPGSEVVDYGYEFSCVKCWRGSYRSIEMRSCEPCPSFMTSERGAESCVRCEIGNQCYACDTNYFRPSWNSTCLKCPRGTYNEYENESTSECSPCPEGTYLRRTGSFCERCWRGSVTGPGGMFCRREGRSCPSNFFENSVGDCHTCDIGYRLNRAQLKCEKCPNGSVSSGGIVEKCDTCPRNQISSPNGKRCECPAGTHLRGARCVKCPIGTVMYEPNRRKSCQPCLYGRAPRRGMTRCIPCADGSTPDLRSRRCEKCDGKDQMIIGEGAYTRCVDQRTRCREYEFRSYYAIPYTSEFSYGSCTPRACTDETPEEEIGVKCLLCEKGSFVSAYQPWWNVEKECRKCDSGETSEGGTTTKCVKCPGLQKPDEITKECACHDGLVKVDDSCSFCSPGSSSEDGLTCTPCKPGYYGNQLTQKCFFCSRGTYSPGGVPVCLTCPSGTRPNRRARATECVPRRNA